MDAGNFTTTGFGGNTGLGADALQDNTTGSNNTASGAEALHNNTSGTGNTAIGALTLAANTTGSNNTATGVNALFQTTGNFNTATGALALNENFTGNANTATGFQALGNNITGGNNTANGVNALENSTGNNNVAVGASAGGNATSGSDNIYLGTSVLGNAADTNTMYLGKEGTQTKTFIAGIRGITTGLADAIPVMIDSAGQLGTVSSSRQFKEDIHDMAGASRRIFRLRPVTFRYQQAYGDGSKPIQYGLVAEEVAEVFPELAVRNASGGVDTVHYEKLNVLLLNELQKQNIEIERQRERIEILEKRINELLGSPQPTPRKAAR